MEKKLYNIAVTIATIVVAMYLVAGILKLVMLFNE